MAQRTGAERFLASPVKTASAGAALALAALALLLTGCGGGSSDPADASTAAGQGTNASSGGDSPGSSSPSGSADSPGFAKATPAAQAEEAPSAGAGVPASGAGAKHGPHITAPKGPREPEPTPAEKASATVADMSLRSPAIRSEEGVLTYTYTCDGKDIWPPLNWSASRRAHKN